MKANYTGYHKPTPMNSHANPYASQWRVVRARDAQTYTEDAARNLPVKSVSRRGDGGFPHMRRCPHTSQFQAPRLHADTCTVVLQHPLNFLGILAIIYKS